MKKLLSFAAAVCVLLASVSGSAACNIKIAGISANPLCKISSYNSNGNTMVPFRSICEALGAKVSWDASTNTASAECGENTVSICTGGEQIITNNGETIELPTPSCNKNGLTYVPLRAICEALGCKVNWNASNGDISIEPDAENSCENCENECADGSCENNGGQNTAHNSLQDIFNNWFGNNHNNSGNTQTETPSNPNQTEEPSANIGSYEQQVLSLVNQQRANYGLSALTYSKELEAVAYAHSKDMAQNNYFSHTNLSGQSPFDRMRQAGISYRSAAENIAAGQKTPQEVVNAWMNSAGHRANILNSSVTKMGVGIYSGGSYGIYWTQLFIG